ncbi:hypothetical protein [Photobacterium leiognathi]|uniref:hypothetical protein n=2 Tax=Photobacterium leiognathi TaxID=553611 RepID=UPI002981ABAD|nr:hypothetical protein [Photobacterium leiognathi]
MQKQVKRHLLITELAFMNNVIALHTLSASSLTPEMVSRFDPNNHSQDFMFLMCKTVDWALACKADHVSRDSIDKKMVAIHEVYCVGTLDDLNLSMCADAAQVLLEAPEAFAKKTVRKFYSSIKQFSPCNTPE